MGRPSISKKMKYMRLIRVESMLIDGFRPQEIIDLLSTEWSIKQRQVFYYIAEVKNQWKAAAVEDPAAMKLKYIDRLEKLYRLSVEDKQYGTAVKIQDVINKMVGVYDREQSEETGPSIITISGRNQAVALNSGSSEVNEEKQNGTES